MGEKTSTELAREVVDTIADRGLVGDERFVYVRNVIDEDRRKMMREVIARLAKGVPPLTTYCDERFASYADVEATVRSIAKDNGFPHGHHTRAVFAELDKTRAALAARDAELAEVRAALPPGGRRAEGGVGEGTWSVFAEKVVAERDAALARAEKAEAIIATLQATCAEYEARLAASEPARARVAALEADLAREREAHARLVEQATRALEAHNRTGTQEQPARAYAEQSRDYHIACMRDALAALRGAR